MLTVSGETCKLPLVGVKRVLVDETAGNWDVVAVLTVSLLLGVV